MTGKGSGALTSNRSPQPPTPEDPTVDALPHLILLAALIYAAANMDDVVVLTGFYADPLLRTRHVTTGQFLGMGVLFGACAAASLLSAAVSPRYLGLAGLFPIALGLVKLWELSRRKRGADDAPPSQADRRRNAVGKILGVTAATIGNSSDALGVWTPVMALHTRAALPVFGLTFAAMTALWCFAAFWLTHHETLGAPIRRFAHRLVPFVLLGLGVFVLASAGSFGLIGGWAMHERH